MRAAGLAYRAWLSHVLAVLLMAFAGSAAYPADLVIPPVTDEGDDGYPVYNVTFANGVVGIPGIAYAQPLHFRPLTLDVYMPGKDSPKSRLPLIVYVHGGAWVTGTPRGKSVVGSWPAILASLAARGYVVAAVSYRLDGEAHFPAAIQDVKAAIRFLRTNADRYGIDPARAAVWGPSAGGQLAALESVSCGVAAFEPPPPVAAPGKQAQPQPAAPVSDCVQGGVSWFGVHNFVTVPVPPGQTGPAPYLGCPTTKCPKETLEFGSPVTYVDSSDPPMLLIHGLADTLVAVSQTKEFEARLREAHVPVQMLLIPDVDHGFIGKTDAISQAATRQALVRTFDFFDKLFGKGSR
jgi:acetyl esterase/lipase